MKKKLYVFVDKKMTDNKDLFDWYQVLQLELEYYIHGVFH